MKRKLKKFWSKIKEPPIWFCMGIFAFTLLCASGALCMLSVDYTGNVLSLFAYSLFALAAISLSYSVYIAVCLAPKIKRAVVSQMEKRNFTHLLLRNFGFRTIIFTIGSFVLNIAFGAFNAYMGIHYRSVWYGALAVYYILLAVMRGGILTHHRQKLNKTAISDEHREEWLCTKIYRNCGTMLLVLNFALSSAIAQMIFDNRYFEYAGWTVIAYAAYAFYKITMSVINTLRAKRQSDLTVQALRNINLADALVSILALQTALLNTFQTESVNISLFNTVTGIAISAIAIAMGILMIAKGNKNMKRIQQEYEDGK